MKYINRPVSWLHGLRSIQKDYKSFPNGVTSLLIKSWESHKGFH